MKNFTRHQHIEPFKLVAVDAALERIDPNCYVGLYSEIICKEIERALYDQLSDEQNTLRYLWAGELRKLNNFLKRLRGKPPTPERLRLRVSKLHEVTKHFLNARLKISGNSKIGLAELDLGSPNDLDELKKAICRAGFTLVSGTYYGCAGRKNKGNCNNHGRITIDRLENAVLSAVQSQMMTPKLTKVFIAEYKSTLSNLRKEAVRSKTEQLQKKDKLEVAINNIVEVVASGHASAALLSRLDALEEDLNVVEKTLRPQEAKPLYFRPNLAEHYARMVSELRALLNKPECKQEAVTDLRKLIDRIDLAPSEDGLLVDIVGDLAAMLHLTTPNMQKAIPKETALAISLVAGVGFEPTTFRL